ncbi:unnamed protein product [Amoebophrya sp. A25]|nr:unnamed protein product [Amoebophrya sp. A25]|eukprot:GSA25T00017472001.1
MAFKTSTASVNAGSAAASLKSPRDENDFDKKTDKDTNLVVNNIPSGEVVLEKWRVHSNEQEGGSSSSTNIRFSGSAGGAADSVSISTSSAWNTDTENVCYSFGQCSEKETQSQNEEITTVAKARRANMLGSLHQGDEGAAGLRLHQGLQSLSDIEGGRAAHSDSAARLVFDPKARGSTMGQLHETLVVGNWSTSDNELHVARQLSSPIGDQVDVVVRQDVPPSPLFPSLHNSPPPRSDDPNINGISRRACGLLAPAAGTSGTSQQQQRESSVHKRDIGALLGCAAVPGEAQRTEYSPGPPPKDRTAAHMATASSSFLGQQQVEVPQSTTATNTSSAVGENHGNKLVNNLEWDRPDLLLLTNRVGEPDSYGEYLHWRDDFSFREDIAPLLRVTPSISLDGIYIQWEPELSTARADKMREISSNCILGVWLASDSVDTLAETTRLVRLGVSYVNSDLPMDWLATARETTPPQRTRSFTTNKENGTRSKSPVRTGSPRRDHAAQNSLGTMGLSSVGESAGTLGAHARFGATATSNKLVATANDATTTMHANAVVEGTTSQGGVTSSGAPVSVSKTWNGTAGPQARDTKSRTPASGRVGGGNSFSSMSGLGASPDGTNSSPASLLRASPTETEESSPVPSP